MAKDHTPGGFNRSSGYKSDLEVAEESGSRINTSFGSGNHNVYIHNNEHTHEHFWYDPGTCQSGYHGANVPTHNNHPAETTAAEETPQENTILENAVESPGVETADEAAVTISEENNLDDGPDGGEDLDDGMDL